LLPSKGDDVLFRKRECDGISLTALQVDDSFGHGTEIQWHPWSLSGLSLDGCPRVPNAETGT
jgi:hypothetical protein